MSLSPVNHIRSTSLPSTTGFWNSPLVRTSGKSFPLSRGGLGAVVAGALGAFDLYRATVNNEENSFLSWSNAVRVLGWGAFAGMIFGYTKPPKNLFQTDLINNGIKDIIENVIEKIGDKSSFIKILSKETLKNLDSILSKISKKMCNILGKNIDPYGSTYGTNMAKELVSDLFSGIDPSLRDRLQEIFKVDDPDERAEQFKELLKEESRGLFQMLSTPQKKDVYKEIVNEFFPPDKKDENAEIAGIRNEINKIIEPIGMNLLSIQRDRPSGEIKLYFVNIKGYSPSDSNKDALLSLPGIMVNVTSEQFFNSISYLVENLGELYGDKEVKKILEGTNISKESIEGLNKEILSYIGVLISDLNILKRARAVHAVYEPKIEKYTSYDVLDPIPDMLSGTAKESKIKLEGIIGHGLNGNVINALGGLGPAGYSGRAGNNDEKMEEVLTGKGGKKRSPGTTAEYDQAAPSTDSKIPNISYFTDAVRELGIIFNGGEDTQLTKLKIVLLNLYLKSVNDKKEIKDFVTYKKEVLDVLNEGLRNNNASLPENLPVKDKDEEKGSFEIQDSFLNIKYFIAIALEGARKYDASNENDLHRQDVKELFKRLTEVKGNDEDVKRLRFLKEYLNLEDWDKLGKQAEIDCQRQINKLAAYNNGGEQAARIRLERLFFVLTKNQSDELRRQLDDLMDSGNGPKEKPSLPEEPSGSKVNVSVTVKDEAVIKK